MRIDGTRECKKHTYLEGALSSKIRDKVSNTNAQSFRDFHQRIHRRGFAPAFNSTNKNSGEVGLFGQSLLAESDIFALGANRLTQKTAVFLDSQHDRLKSKKL